MNTAIIEKVLNVVCEELSKKWYGYDTNTILRDNFINSVMSYENIISKKYLEYLFIHMNIECDYDSELINEYYAENLQDDIIKDILNDYANEELYEVEITPNKPLSTYRIMVYQKTNTIKEIKCDYSYLSNYEYCDVFEE